MTEPLLSKQQIAAGHERFLAQYPAARARVKAVTQDVADAIGSDLAELRYIEVANALSDVAGSLGVDSFEFLLRFAVETETERQQILDALHDDMKRALGLE